MTTTANEHSYNILSISGYGDLYAEMYKKRSGALDRQYDYARQVDSYVILARTSQGDAEPVHHGNFVLYPVFAHSHISFLWRAWRRRDVITKHRITLVLCDSPHVTGLLGWLLKKMMGVKLVVHNMAQMIGNEHYIRERFFNRVKTWVGHAVNKRADAVRISTRAEQAIMREHGVDHAYYVPFYIDIERFQQKLQEADTESGRSHPRILFVGRLAKQKDLATLIRAARRVVKEYPDAEFMLVGDGPERDNLQRLVDEYGLSQNVTFTGAVAYSEVVSYFKNSDIFCLTSLYEGTCMVLHEAAVAGLAIVSTDVAGASDLIEDGESGSLALVGDERAVAEKLMRLLADANTRARYAERIQKKVTTEVTKENALEQYSDMLRDVTESS